MGYLDNLFYIKDGSRDLQNGDSIDYLPIPLPDWAKFYGNVGEWIARSETASSRVVVALSVPTRSFCSPLLAAGAISYIAATFDPSKTTFREKFNYLKQLPDGTGVLIKDKLTGRMKKGFKEGFEVVEGYGPRIRFQVTRRGANSAPIYELLGPDQCHDIELDPSESPVLPVNPTSTAMNDGYQVWSNILADHKANATNYYGSNSFDCLIIGQIEGLRSEVKDGRFAVPSKASTKEAPATAQETEVQFSEGTLQDILRTKRLEPSSSMNAYNSQIWSSRARHTSGTENDVAPRMVCFDGALAFLKWKYLFRESSWAVVLDRTEHQYQQAVFEINDEFSHRGPDGLQLDTECPSGVDVMAFYGGS